MQILVIAATEMEIAPFLESYPAAHYLITGVGAATSVYKLTKHIQHFDYDCIIQVGIAGSFSTNLLPGETVFIKQDCFADVGAIEKNEFKSLFDMNLANADEDEFQNGWLVNNNLNKFGLLNKEVNAITVNLLSDNSEYIKQLHSKYNVDVESMEGAVLHYVCLHEKIPFIQIRGISNYVGERDKSKWKMKEAIESSNKTLIELYNRYTSKIN